MVKNVNQICLLGAIAMIIQLLSACSTSEGNNPGHEYMPDMAHSTAFEANLYDYYRFNTWGTEADYKELAMPRKPVAGTIPLGYAGMGSNDKLKKVLQNVPVNGNVPYYYDDTEEERTRAMNEITQNPFPITSEGLDHGKELYEIFCGICHGNEADGLGYLVREDGGVYPAQPANLVSEEFIASSEGRFYHAIIYGKNVMGGYADKISYEERWNVIHYIRSLQAKAQSLQYNESVNTLNNAIPVMTLEMEDDLSAEVTEDAEMQDDHH